MLTDTTYAPRYMPLGWFCYALERELFGLRADVWHAGNLLVHVLNTLLLFAFLRRLVLFALQRRPPSPSSTPDGPDAGSLATWCGALGALWWAIHPLRVEPVAWASARIYAVAIAFALVWLWAWLQAQAAPTDRRRRLYEWTSLAAFAASLLTYPLALFAPIALFALDVYPLRRAPLVLRGWLTREAWPLWREKIPFLLVTGAVLVLTAAVRIGSDPRLRPVSLAEFGLLDRAMQACYVVGYYAWKPWSPTALAPAYPTLHAFEPLSWVFVASALALVVVTAAAFLLRRRWPALAAAWICHGVVLIPVLGLSEYPHSAFDRYAHLHGLLWAAAIAGLLAACWPQPILRRLVTTGLAAVCLCLAGLSVLQIPMWRDTLSLYEGIVDRFGKHPGRGRFDEVLGVYQLRAGRTNEAVRAFQRAVDYDAQRSDRHLYQEGVVPRCERRLADLCLAAQDPAGAAGHLTAALQAETERSLTVSTALKLSATLAELDQPARALPWLQKAVGLAPEDPRLHRELARTFARLGQAASAERHAAEEERLRQLLAGSARE
jgi:tetratricopeptide (TPR) repeat protein